MMSMSPQRTVRVVIRADEDGGYVAECSLLHLFTQGDTLDEVVANLREAAGSGLEDEDFGALGLSEVPLLRRRLSWNRRLPELCGHVPDRLRVQPAREAFGFM